MRRERRDVPAECVKLQLTFGEWMIWPRDKPLAAVGRSHLTRGSAILTGGRATLKGGEATRWE